MRIAMSPHVIPVTQRCLFCFVNLLYPAPSRSRLERCEWMSRSGTVPLRTPSHLSVATAVSANVSPPYPGTAVPCRFPQDGGRSELARRPACRLVLSIHDELLYEVGGWMARIKW